MPLIEKSRALDHQKLALDDAVATVNYVKELVKNGQPVTDEVIKEAVQDLEGFFKKIQYYQNM